MKKFIFSVLILLYSSISYAQNNNIYDLAYTDFNNLIEYFLQRPTDQTRNEEILNQLKELKNTITGIHVTKEERYKLNSLVGDIVAVTEFMAPISNSYNAHLSNYKLERLQDIFGSNFTKFKLNVNCPKNEIEFIEVHLSDLIICYLHCFSRKAENGVRVKFKAISDNVSSSGEYGAMINELTPVIHNAGKKYLKIKSATITKHF